MRGNVRKTWVLMRECSSAISGNETFSLGLTRMRTPLKPAGAGAASACCGVIAFPKRLSPIATPRKKRSRHCDVLFSIRVRTRAVEIRSIFIFHLSQFWNDALGSGRTAPSLTAA